jgi:hypothetical protein
MRRHTYIENRRVLADSGEITVDINVRDPITSIWLEVRATNGATYNKNNSLASCIDSVDLIDGGNVLWSLDGYELLALTAYRLGFIPYNLVEEIPGNTQNLSVCLMFGRWFGDTEYSFDPAQFSNPQIRFKWNLANVNAVGATGYVSGTGRLTIFADVMEGAASPQAMIVAKELYAFTTAASGDETIDMPIDKRLKGLLVRSASNSGGGLYGISQLKLSGDNDKFIPFDMRKTDFQRWLTLKAKPFSYKHNFVSANGGTLYPILKQDEGVSLIGEIADLVLEYTNHGIGNGTVTIYTAGSADTAQRNLYGVVTGWMPYASGYIELGEWDDPSTWLDATVFKKLKLILTQDAASSSAFVVVEQEHVYGL